MRPTLLTPAPWPPHAPHTPHPGSLAAPCAPQSKTLFDRYIDANSLVASMQNKKLSGAPMRVTPQLFLYNIKATCLRSPQHIVLPEVCDNICVKRVGWGDRRASCRSSSSTTSRPRACAAHSTSCCQRCVTTYV
eukprot:356713-Chlamydomonas_euryale.AAC.1